MRCLLFQRYKVISRAGGKTRLQFSSYIVRHGSSLPRAETRRTGNDESAIPALPLRVSRGGGGGAPLTVDDKFYGKTVKT